ncbi:MAG: dimethyl sulfoxide reductase anchor subunit [Bacteroidales bacterium]|nr:dimethyl sulfoxide reductase anchor subunit [Bacteroidales bacterium]MCF8351187.1 dimethyl sulfoxide reductase anchor subunit [Bacteroidales bacterium]MCF8375316.1 dimethyl sulfoxide reductase anchor subunit [Bacteroidales bacterium]MCF8400172.1 dimethyl sulfoxide reductase anchor subunit [Bacteroidales bacterium]
MHSNEWVLVIFTLMSQLAVGLFVMQELYLAYRHMEDPEMRRVKKNVLYTDLVLVIIALIISFFHLGKPSNATNALSNLQSSWLSREILFLSIFTICLIIYTFIFSRSTINTLLLKLFGIFTLLSGIMFLFSMAKIYMLENAPVWNTAYTPIEFFTCSLLLGSLLLMSLIQNRLMRFDAEELSFFARRMFSLFLLITLLLVIDMGAAIYHHFIDFTPNSPGRPDSSYLPSIVKFLFLIISLIAIIFQFYNFNLKKRFTSATGISFVFVFVLIAEVIGRYMFYASYLMSGVKY